MADSKTRFASLHSHLGSSVKASDLYQFSKLSGHKHNLGEYHEFVSNIHVENQELHAKYLNRYKVVQEIQSTSLDIIERSVFNAIITAYTENQCDVIELRFNPMLRNRGGTINLDAVILHACIGLQRAKSIFPVKAGIIIETDRGFTPDQTNVLFKKAVKFKDMGVMAVDVSGPNLESFSIKEHSSAFHYAASNGLKVTAHCGEVAGPDEIWEFINTIPVDRLGHGINAYKDQKLMDELSNRNICLEICPVSNVMTGVVKKEDIRSAINILHNFEVPLTICDDGFLFLGANIRQNYDFIGVEPDVEEAFIKAGFDFTFAK